MVLTGVAAAGVVATRLSSDPPTQSGTNAAVPTLAPSAAAASEKATLPEPAVPESPKSADVPSTPKISLIAPDKNASFTSASEAFRAANEARRAGKTTEAIAAYQLLQRRFARSPEAHASRVSLAGLLLRAGKASAALVQFDAYLASSGGQLTAEALFGRTQALRALGRTAEEAQDLNRLVKTYPKSAYATHAESRLAELR
jgi:TolA-binding protein